MAHGIRINDSSGASILDSSKNPGLVVDFVRTGNITTTGYFSQTFTDSRYAGCVCVPVTVYANAIHNFNASISGGTATISGYVNFAGGGNSVYAGAWIIRPTQVG